MRKVLNIATDKITPPLRTIYRAQGIPDHVTPDKRTQSVAEEAIMKFKELSSPIAVLDEIGKENFKSVFGGAGRNAAESPVGPIFELSEHLALFAMTLGDALCAEISHRFRDHDYAIASMLDSVASEAAEIAAQHIETEYKRYLTDQGLYNSQYRALRFSPGYCGWDLSGQAGLFERVHPDEIGMTLNDSFLMTPIKSISGIIIVGQKRIFEFDDTFSFCRDCTTHTCRERLKALIEE